jgi:hypothetical protein
MQALLSTQEAQVIYRTVSQRLYAAATRLVRRYEAKGEVRDDVDAEAVGRSMIDHATVHFIEAEVFGADAADSGRYLRSRKPLQPAKSTSVRLWNRRHQRPSGK